MDSRCARFFTITQLMFFHSYSAPIFLGFFPVPTCITEINQSINLLLTFIHMLLTLIHFILNASVSQIW